MIWQEHQSLNRQPQDCLPTGAAPTKPTVLILWLAKWVENTLCCSSNVKFSNILRKLHPSHLLLFWTAQKLAGMGGGALWEIMNTEKYTGITRGKGNSKLKCVGFWIQTQSKKKTGRTKPLRGRGAKSLQQCELMNIINRSVNVPK